METSLLGALLGIPAKMPTMPETAGKKGLLRLEYGGVTIGDLDALRSYGD